MDPLEILRTVETVLVIDWPSRDVPEALARAGFLAVVRGGAGPEDYFAYEWKDGEAVPRHVGRPPDRAELVYSYRPLRELPEIIITARKLKARTIWTQSGLRAPGVKDPKGCWLSEEDLRTAESLLRAAGLSHISAPYIGDVAARLRPSA